MPYWAVAPYGDCTDSSAFQLLSVDPHDAGNLATIVGYKSTNPKLKVMLSVGGWNYPSSYFSAMASTPANRAVFISSVKSWIAQYSADGIDLDWEYPCSPVRNDPVEITCTDFQTVSDKGGSCPEDTNNIVSLFKELRASLGPSVRITVASQASKPLEIEMAITQLDPYVDAFHLMSYDYTVSDIVEPTGAVLAPNAPLYTPSNPNVTQMSISYTVQNYLNASIDPAKIMLGIALYGHTWFSPGLSGGSAWKGFGAPADVQGACCGPFVSTNGAKPGQGSALCGTYMYSEIVAAGAQLQTLDNETKSDIAYFTGVGKDGYTAPGTWITYTGPDSAREIVAYARSKGLGGVFTFDSSMDTLSSSGQWTYELTNVIATALAEEEGGA
jgi:chitinase